MRGKLCAVSWCYDQRAVPSPAGGSGHPIHFPSPVTASFTRCTEPWKLLSLQPNTLSFSLVRNWWQFRCFVDCGRADNMPLGCFTLLALCGSSTWHDDFLCWSRSHSVVEGRLCSRGLNYHLRHSYVTANVVINLHSQYCTQLLYLHLI